MNEQLGRIGVMTRLKALNKVHRTITTNDNGVLIAQYKIPPIKLQEEWEHVNNLVAISMMESPEEHLQTYQDEIDQLTTSLLAMKGDLDYQDLILEFVTTYPQYRELFE